MSLVRQKVRVCSVEKTSHLALPHRRGGGKAFSESTLSYESLKMCIGGVCGKAHFSSSFSLSRKGKGIRIVASKICFYQANGHFSTSFVQGWEFGGRKVQDVSSTLWGWGKKPSTAGTLPKTWRTAQQVMFCKAKRVEVWSTDKCFGDGALCFHRAQARTRRRRERRRDLLYWWTLANSFDKGVYKTWKLKLLGHFYGRRHIPPPGAKEGWFIMFSSS